VLNDAHLSSRHAQIEIAGGSATFRDLGSTNGSYTLEGHRITALPLSVGSAVRLGGCTITVRTLKAAFGPAGTMVMNATDPAPVPAPGPFGAAPVPQAYNPNPGMAPPGAPPPAGFAHGQAAAVAAPPAAPAPGGAAQSQYGVAPGHPVSPPAQYGAPPEQMQHGSPPGPAHYASPQNHAHPPSPQAPQAYGAHAQYGVPAAPAAAAAGAGAAPDLAADWAGFLKNCWSSYQPHWQDGAMILGYFSVLPQLIIAALL